MNKVSPEYLPPQRPEQDLLRLYDEKVNREVQALEQGNFDEAQKAHDEIGTLLTEMTFINPDAKKTIIDRHLELEAKLLNISQHLKKSD